jgi:aspartate carbamoyltransferase catalytic subunit
MNRPQHLVSSQDIDKNGYDEIMRLAEHFLETGIPPHLMEGKVVATLFFQPSTRTQARFQCAMIRAGGGWLGDAGTTST